MLAHICEKKRRFMQRDEKPVKMGFSSYQRYFERAMCRKKLPTYEMFARNKLYTAFVRFGRYLMNINAVNPLGFIDFLIKVDAGIDRWEHPDYYETYMRELTKTELPYEALERNMKLMQSWEIDSGEHWTDFFRKVAPSQATLWIRSGRISPWVLLTAPSAEELFARLSPEQDEIVTGLIDVDFWRIKINNHAADVAVIQQELEKAGI